MSRNRFWLTDEQFKKIANHLPTSTRGKPRVDDRRVISGIIHVLKFSGRWVDAPASMDRTRPSTTASFVGLRRASGSICFMRLQAQAAHPLRC
jgi:transposase